MDTSRSNTNKTRNEAVRVVYEKEESTFTAVSVKRNIVGEFVGVVAGVGEVLF